MPFWEVIEAANFMSLLKVQPESEDSGLARGQKHDTPPYFLRIFCISIVSFSAASLVPTLAFADEAPIISEEKQPQAEAQSEKTTPLSPSSAELFEQAEDERWKSKRFLLSLEALAGISYGSNSYNSNLWGYPSDGSPPVLLSSSRQEQSGLNLQILGVNSTVTAAVPSIAFDYRLLDWLSLGAIGGFVVAHRVSDDDINTDIVRVQIGLRAGIIFDLHRRWWSWFRSGITYESSNNQSFGVDDDFMLDISEMIAYRFSPRASLLMGPRFYTQLFSAGSAQTDRDAWALGFQMGFNANF